MTGTANRPRWLVPTLAAAGSALVTTAAVFGVAGLLEEEPAARSTAHAASPAAPSSPAPSTSSIPGPVTGPVDACDLVSPATLREFGLNPTDSQSGRDRRSDGSATTFCEWTDGYTGESDTEYRSLRVYTVLFPTRKKAVDHIDFERRLTRQAANTESTDDGSVLGSGPYQELQGVGSEAFAQSTVQPGHSATKVWTRYENVALQTTHVVGVIDGTTVADPSVNPAAEKVARQAVEALARCRTTCSS